MDKYQNKISLNSTVPITNHRFLNTGPLYTIGGSKSQQGPQLLMNATSVGTATQFQFVPARNSSTNFSASFPIDMGSFTPIFNSVKTFFVNLIKPKVLVDTSSTYATYNTTEKRKCNSAPNIYMDIMSDRKCSDGFEKNIFVDLTDGEMLAKLSASTKSFSDYNLPTSTIKINCKGKSPEVTRKMDLNVPEEPKPQIAKEIEKEISVPVVKSSTSPLQTKQRKRRSKMPNLLMTPRKQCPDAKRTNKKKTKNTTKLGKNKKEKERHELVLNIHEDVETENEMMSADEWEEPLVIISVTKSSPIEPFPKASPATVCFSKDDFPAMPVCNTLNNKNNSNFKQTWQLPRLSHCFSSLKGRKQREVSECDSEDSFIVFDSDDKQISSSVESNQSICDKSTLLSGRRRQISESSEDDFICFELEKSDTDDDDCDDRVTSDSDCESEDDDESSGTSPPDSGLGVKTVRFNLIPVVHVLRTWTFAYQQARKGQWEQNGRDRVRFHDRIKRLESTLVPILDFDHRQKIYCDRFIRDADNDIWDSAK